MEVRRCLEVLHGRCCKYSNALRKADVMLLLVFDFMKWPEERMMVLRMSVDGQRVNE